MALESQLFTGFSINQYGAGLNIGVTWLIILGGPKSAMCVRKFIYEEVELEREGRLV